MDTLRKTGLEIAIGEDFLDYELIDSGNGFKFERFGEYKLIRPEPQAIWQTKISLEKWGADARFVGTESLEEGRWKFNKQVKTRWIMEYKGIKFWAQLTSFRHLGVFPEQSSQWEWIRNEIGATFGTVKILNLFGYTGIASFIAAASNASVTHVDASKKTISWARENQILSNLENKPIRWIVDDAYKFVQRENRRGVKYEGIILDPPKYGRGPNGETWKIEDLLPSILLECRKLLSDRARFIALTTYANKLSSISLSNLMGEIMKDFGGKITAGELTTRESEGGRLLPNAIFARWQRE